jgi:phosphoglycolate phosphatase
MIICLFDIDGTLLASGGAGKAALESAFCDEFSVALRHQVPYSGRTDRAIIRDLLRLHDIDYTVENRDRLFAGYLQRLPDRLVRNQGRVLPGMLELLQSLRQRDDIAIGLLTGNLRAGAKVKLGHFGIYDHFAFGGFGDHHYDRDDVAREALQAAHAHTASTIPGDRVWVIGDTPLDVQCARAIGARVVAVATGVHSVEQLQATSPDLTLADFADAAPFLKLL